MSKQFIQTLTEQQLKLLSRKWLCVIANNKFGKQTEIARKLLMND